MRHYPEQNPVLRDLLPSITTPTQIVAGRDDDLVPWSNNEYLDDLLPNSEIHPLDAGHFAWEQAAEEYGRLVADWVSGGYRARRSGLAGRSHRSCAQSLTTRIDIPNRQLGAIVSDEHLETISWQESAPHRGDP